MDVTSVTLEALEKNPFSPYRMQSEERRIFFFFSEKVTLRPDSVTPESGIFDTLDSLVLFRNQFPLKCF